MTRMLSTMLAVALAVPAPSVAIRARVALVFDRSTPARLEASLVDEAARVWEPYGVLLVDGTNGTAPAAGVLTLRVAILDKAPPDLSEHALGSIAFRADLPDAAISLYAGTASGLVWTAAAGAISHWPPAFHEVVTARVLGRALAHEIGHYLLRTREHAPSGLMRADLPMLELMEANERKLTLSPHEQAALTGTVSRAGAVANE